MDESYLEFHNAYENIIQGINDMNILSANDCLSPAAKILNQTGGGDVGMDQSLLPKSMNKSKLITSRKNILNVKDTKKSNNKDIMDIGGIVIHLGNINDEDDDDDEEDNDQSFETMEEDFDPNVTFTVKTMKPRRLSAFLNALNGSEK